MFTLNERKLMTKIQIEIYTIACGMMMEGCSKDEVLGYLAVMEYNAQDIVDVMKKFLT
jgi:hypothetical protein